MLERASAESRADEAGFKFFEDKVRPILANHCYECHGPASGDGKANLRLDSSSAVLKGGRSGPALIPGEPERSLMILAVRHEGDVSMPPKTKLAPNEISAIETWIKMGARWPGTTTSELPAKPTAGQPRWDDQARRFWAFQARGTVCPPEVVDLGWPLSPVDRFILTKLEAKGIQPAKPAHNRDLLRRATFDLIGLPPTPLESDAFLRDDDPLAFERALDRLLASPAYGERWGRHWLDLVRYADSNGMDDNLAYSDAWRYRDYVIATFNADKSFDQFLEEQLAGDLLAESDPKRRDELIVATGFLAIGPKMLAEDDPVKQQMDIVDEQLDTTSRVFMALTMGCARCHDHKFDPLEQSDYYALAGIFKSTQTMISHRVDSKWNTTGLGSIQAALRLDDLEQIIDRHDNLLVNGNPVRMPSGAREAHTELLEAAKREYAAIPKAMAVVEGTPGDLAIFLRGNHLTRGPLVARRFPAILTGRNGPALDPKHSGRLALARWLSGASHPLTARVIVNRVWRWHFGRGLVSSVDNFGKLGQLPTHPELLDWLANKLVSQGWSLKRLHKEIMLSRTYQMSTRWDRHAATVDPENSLLWRMPRRRLEAEELRDSILAAGGLLERRMRGTLLASSPFQDLSADGLARRPSLYESSRRSVYLPVLRGALHEMYRTFDFPDPAVSSGDRAVTTVATQALFMMNSPLVAESCSNLAAKLLADDCITEQDRLGQVCQSILRRPAEPEELEEWSAFLARYETFAISSGKDPAARHRMAWEGLCRALLSSNEFLYVE
jgi:Protein of unknown function (DUF1553)/Protein of unknown function (DUF1549)/Planctomycete cytochrome C